ncbi:response regulator [Falsiroseomonas selenitidurans]|uniref:Response regulator n=1 Tax=Falsiroseomonas selenitidurans TaxID=2716335 RepID=A0ABX1E5T0_9PROT|nr:response regulator [Falsiroseomonas selenitidurans]NKC31107.1 response regulator [Falsiroseomonas selenitidurans]
MLPTFQDQPASSGSPPWSPRVLVVDDDPDMRRMVVDFLLDNGLRATGVVERQDVERQLARDDLAMILLDLRLGAQSGLDLLRDIRARSDLPVIIITGERREEVDRVIGLELGADDYVTKPFSPRELLARIRAVLRRQAVNPGPRREAVRHRFEGWVLDRRIRRLTAPDGAEVRLTKGEFALLSAFLDAPRRPLSRENLLQATRMHEDVFDRSIDVQVLRLRRKLDADRAPSMIRTERGIGYVFDVTVERI